MGNFDESSRKFAVFSRLSSDTTTVRGFQKTARAIDVVHEEMRILSPSLPKKLHEHFTNRNSFQLIYRILKLITTFTHFRPNSHSSRAPARTSHSHAKDLSSATTAKSHSSAALSSTWPFHCSVVKCTDRWRVPVKLRDKHPKSRSRRRKRRRQDVQSDAFSSIDDSLMSFKASDVVAGPTLIPHKLNCHQALCILWFENKSWLAEKEKLNPIFSSTTCSTFVVVVFSISANAFPGDQLDVNKTPSRLTAIFQSSRSSRTRKLQEIFSHLFHLRQKFHVRQTQNPTGAIFVGQLFCFLLDWTSLQRKKRRTVEIFSRKFLLFKYIYLLIWCDKT